MHLTVAGSVGCHFHFHQDYCVVLHAVLFAVDRYWERLVTGITAGYIRAQSGRP